MKTAVPMLLLCLAAAPASAQITLLTQNRSVHAVWSSGDQQVAAPDFSRFTASIGRIDEFPGGTGAIATQDSTIAPDLFSYAGNVTAFRSGSLAESIYIVTFSVPAARTFAFDANVVGGSAFGSGSLHAILSGPGGELFNASAFNVGGLDQRIQEAGTLVPGDYSLSINYSVRGLSTSVDLGGQGFATMSIVPAPGALAGLVAGGLLVLRRRR